MKIICWFLSSLAYALSTLLLKKIFPEQLFFFLICDVFLVIFFIKVGKMLCEQWDEYKNNKKNRIFKTRLDNGELVEILECKSCGYRDTNFFNSCPKCKSYAKQYIYEDTQKTFEPNQILFCSKCGEKLVGESQFCHKCGEKIEV